ncbi:MAG: FliH/SctL family protein [Alphaproteobacteria bacterium]|nr:FliH/SctL family protein [Alphaproteobacteria bacterium]
MADGKKDKDGRAPGSDPDPFAALAGGGDDEVPSLDELMALGQGLGLDPDPVAGSGLSAFFSERDAAQAPASAPPSNRPPMRPARRGLDAFLDEEPAPPPAATPDEPLMDAEVSDADLDSLIGETTFIPPRADAEEPEEIATFDDSASEPVSEAALDALLGGGSGASLDPDGFGGADPFGEFGAPLDGAGDREFGSAVDMMGGGDPFIDMPAFDEDLTEGLPPALAAAAFASTAPAARPPTVRKFLFDLSFDRYDPPPPPEPEPEPEPEPVWEPEPEPVWEPPPPPPPPTFSEEELAAARAAAFADGEATGRAQALQSLEHRIARAMEAMAATLPQVLNDRDRAAEAFSHEAARLAHALVRRLVPDLTRRYGLGEIEAVVRESLAKAVDQPRILVRVRSELIDSLQPKIDVMTLETGFQGRVMLVGDDTLGDGDVRCDWGDGGAERLTQRSWDDLSGVLARVVGTLEQAAPVPPAGRSTGRASAA